MDYPIISEDRAGTFIAAGNLRTADEVSDTIISEAINHGHVISYADAVWWTALVWIDGGGRWAYTPDAAAAPASQGLSEMARTALDFLNEIAPHGHTFVLDGDVNLLPTCDTEDFEPRWDDCPHGEDCLNRVRHG